MLLIPKTSSEAVQDTVLQEMLMRVLFAFFDSAFSAYNMPAVIVLIMNGVYCRKYITVGFT